MELSLDFIKYIIILVINFITAPIVNYHFLTSECGTIIFGIEF